MGCGAVWGWDSLAVIVGFSWGDCAFVVCLNFRGTKRPGCMVSSHKKAVIGAGGG